MFGGLIALVAYGAYKVKQNIDLLKSAKITLVNVKIDAKNALSWSLSIVLGVENKSEIEVEVVGYSVDVKLNGVDVASSKNKTSQIVAANGKSQIVIPVSLNTKGLAGVLTNSKMWQSIFKGDISGIFIGVKGAISVSHSGVTINDIPIDFQEHLSDVVAGKS